MATGEGSHYQVRFSVDLPGLPNRLQARLQHLLNLVTFGYRAAEKLQGWELSVPGTSMMLELSTHSKAWDPKVTKDSFFAWHTRNAVRDAVEAFSAYLEQVREVCGLWAMVTLREDQTVLGEEWNCYNVREAKKFHGSGLPAKLAYLSEQYSVALPDDKLRYVLSINRARNCFVHRDGIVRVNDIPATAAEISDALEVRRAANTTEKWTTGQLVEALREAGADPFLALSWIRLETSVETTAGETTILSGEPLEVHRGDRIALSVREIRRNFQIGERIQLQPVDFAEICFTLSVASKDLRRSLEAFGRSRGIVFREPGPSKAATGQASDV